MDLFLDFTSYDGLEHLSNIAIRFVVSFDPLFHFLRIR